ncbi:MAG: D-alanyl-D-alanine carboxypeptidase family protein [Acetivibrionales bacterium]
MKGKPVQVLTIIIALFILFASQISYAESENKPEVHSIDEDTSYLPVGPNVDAASAILMESELGQVLYKKSPNERLHISAANKIMTCLVAIEKSGGNLDAKVTISKESVEAEGSALNLEVGEKYSLSELLYAVMLTSANDAAKAVAEFSGGDVSSFVAMMNNKASEINLKDTHFTNPTGLFDENQYTTAYDVALLIKYSISKFPEFNRIFSTQVKPWTRANGEMHVLTSQNELFWSYDGVDGGKTGYNNKEQQTAITTATRGNQKLICVVLDSPEQSVFPDSTKILDFGFNNFRKGILVRKNDPLETVTLKENQIHLISLIDVYYTHPIGESYVKTLEMDIEEDLTLPIDSNRILGTAKYVLNDNTIIEVNLYSDREISIPESFYDSMKKRFIQNKDILILVGILLAIEVLIILYHIIRLISKLVRKIFISIQK